MSIQYLEKLGKALMNTDLRSFPYYQVNENICNDLVSALIDLSINTQDLLEEINESRSQIAELWRLLNKKIRVDGEFMASLVPEDASTEYLEQMQQKVQVYYRLSVAADILELEKKQQEIVHRLMALRADRFADIRESLGLEFVQE